MTMKTQLFCAAAALLALAAAPASAQTHRSSASSAPAATSTPLTYGAPIPGVCVYSNTRVLETSSVGKAFGARMQQLRAQAAAELSGQQTQLQNDEKVLAGKRATLTQEQFAQQAQPLAAREQQLQQTAELRSRDLQYTYQRQVQRIGESIEPLVRSSFEAHHCSVLLNGDAIMAANPAMDLTTEVTGALNGRMSTITFDRETRTGSIGRSSHPAVTPDPRFFETLSPLGVSTLAALVGAELAPGQDGGRVIGAVAPLGHADAGAVSFLADRKHLEALSATVAGACFVRPDQGALVPSTCIALLSREPQAAYAKAANRLHRPRRPEAGAPLVDPSCQVEDGVVLGRASC